MWPRCATTSGRGRDHPSGPRRQVLDHVLRPVSRREDLRHTRLSQRRPRGLERCDVAGDPHACYQVASSVQR
jgi:hypothetical protein